MVETRVMRPVFLAALPLIFLSCSAVKESRDRQPVVVFHAGSLSVPFLEIAEVFEKEHPNFRVVREAAGSRTCARKITDLGRQCDVLASADFRVVEDLLMPEYADWNIKFARNELCLAYHDSSTGLDRLKNGGWLDVLTEDDVNYGRSDPNSDPCGYRTVQALRLAERHFGKPDIAQRLLAKDSRFVRPKSSDLISLLETRSIDYIFMYRSVAEQHGFPYLALPDEVNLGNPELADWYAKTSATISGDAPGTVVTERGTPMLYSVTIPRNAENPEGAEAFVLFLLRKDKGLRILEKHHQAPAMPITGDNWDRIPESLQTLVLPDDSRRKASAG